MKPDVNIKILCGGVSDEREVSLRTGESIFKALDGNVSVDLIRLDENQIPEGLKVEADIIFPAIHGKYGEDGGLQDQLENAGLIYAGCDAASSRLCMDKSKSKQTVADAGVPVLSELIFPSENVPEAESVIEDLGDQLIIKPTSSGSSVGLFAPDGSEALKDAFSKLDESPYKGSWMIEPRVTGR